MTVTDMLLYVCPHINQLEIYDTPKWLQLGQQLDEWLKKRKILSHIYMTDSLNTIEDLVWNAQNTYIAGINNLFLSHDITLFNTVDDKCLKLFLELYVRQYYDELNNTSTLNQFKSKFETFLNSFFISDGLYEHYQLLYMYNADIKAKRYVIKHFANNIKEAKKEIILKDYINNFKIAIR